jgi:hypothetical protein
MATIAAEQEKNSKRAMAINLRFLGHIFESCLRSHKKDIV